MNNSAASVSPLADDAAALAAIPANGEPQGSLYAIEYEGSAPVGSAALAIPADAGNLETLDLYGWDGSAWRFIPSQIDTATQQIISQAGHNGPLENPAAFLDAMNTFLHAIAQK